MACKFRQPFLRNHFRALTVVEQDALLTSTFAFSLYCTVVPTFRGDQSYLHVGSFINYHYRDAVDHA